MKSLDSLHGWADGDPFYVNYVGHPIQGSVAGFIFVQSDRKYRCAEFGKNREYWKVQAPGSPCRRAPVSARAW